MMRTETQLPMNTPDRIRKLLADRGDIRMALLFGSQATERVTPRSDLDLAVMMDAPMSAEAKAALIAELAELSGRPVDLVDLRTAGEPLLGQVLMHGVRLLGDDVEYARLIRRHVFEEADFMPYRRRILEERRRAWIGK